MKDFETGMHYLRKVALEEGMIAESDNDGVLVEKLAKFIKAGPRVEIVTVEVQPAVEVEKEKEEVPPSAKEAEGVPLPIPNFL